MSRRQPKPRTAAKHCDSITAAPGLMLGRYRTLLDQLCPGQCVCPGHARDTASLAAQRVPGVPGVPGKKNDLVRTMRNAHASANTGPGWPGLQEVHRASWGCPISGGSFLRVRPCGLGRRTSLARSGFLIDLTTGATA